MMLPPDSPALATITTRRQLFAEGYDDRAISAAVRRGLLHRVRPGSYVAAAVWASLDAAEQHAVTARAAAQKARTPVVISHASGLPFYRAPTWGFDLSEVHLTREDGKVGRREAGVCQHRGKILPGDVVEQPGFKLMSATRIALEITTLVGVEASLVAVNHLLHERLTDLTRLRERAEPMTYWPRTLTTDLVLRLANPKIESAGESRLYHVCWRQGLPLPAPQVEILDRTGALVGRVDFAWPELKVFLEFDGRVKYERYLRKGESVTDAVLREKRREERICELTGWRCIRVTWADLANPELLARRIRAAFAAAA